MRSGTAPCGLRYAVRRGGSAVGYCALSIRCGTRDEAGFGNGIAHFTEHTMFRGTTRKSAPVIGSYLDRLGGELNAYTTKEEIVLHATVLKEDLGKAARLLFELATEATFPDAEIETERGVVLDEIISYKDNPAEDVYDKFEGMLFEGHPLGLPILGTTASVKRLKPEDLRRFVKTFFIPERMAFTVVADIDEKVMEKRVRRLVSRLFENAGEGDSLSSASLRDPVRANAPEREFPSPTTSSIPSAPPFSKTVDKRNHEVNAVIGGAAPSLYEEKDRIAAVLLANILGGPASNSILNDILREKNGWVYGVECGYTQYNDTGIMAISLGCDKDNLEKCFRAIDKAIANLQDKPLSDRKLKAAKKQLLGQLAISSESGEAQCLSMGKSLLAFGRVASSAENKAAIEAVSASDLQEIARRVFAPDNLSRLIYL
jgi:predicted Zn-dependent peptidase